MNELTDMQELERMGSVFVKSKFFADTTDAAQAIVKIMAGRELGIAPIAAMTGIHIIKGKPSLGANLQAAKIKSSGKYNYRVKQNTAAVCEIEFFERMANDWESIGVSVFTIEDARKAGTQNIEKYPRNMLFARAMSNGAKWFCPDAFGGIAPYVPEELGANVDENGDVVAETKIVALQDLTSTARAETVDERAASVKAERAAQQKTEWVEELDETGEGLMKEHLKASLPEMNLPAVGVKIPSHTGTPAVFDAFQELEKFVSKHAQSVGKVKEIPETAMKRYRQEAAMNLSKTALGSDDELRHKFVFQMFSRAGLTDCNAQELCALRDWSTFASGKQYIAEWVKKFETEGAATA